VQESDENGKRVAGFWL